MKKLFILPVLVIIFLSGQFVFADSDGGWTGNEQEGANVLRQLNPFLGWGNNETWEPNIWEDAGGGSLWPGWQDIPIDTGPIWFDGFQELEDLRNQGPTADAGPDQTVDEGTTVTLDASNSSDPGDGIASYQWTQTLGTPVTIDNDAAAQATFVAPDSGPPNEMLTFELGVSDNNGLSATDSVAVYVSHEADGDLAPFGDRDGIVNVGDSLVAMRFALGLLTPTQEDFYHGDTAPLDNQGEPVPDGQITVGDALIILQKALGIGQ